MRPMGIRKEQNPTRGPLRALFFALKKERILPIFGVIFGILVGGALSLYLLEGRTNKSLSGIGDAFYWAVISMTTTGYGDITPLTAGGRIVAMIVVVSGLILLSVVTSTVTSIFVERKIREGRGLETIKWKGHIVLCGWNPNVPETIEALLRLMPPEKLRLVLVNELPEEEGESLRYKYRELEIKVLRGDFTREDVLSRANIREAASAIVLADAAGGAAREAADERTILATLAIKSMAPEVKTCAELLNPENRQHLKRANVDEIVVRGEHMGSLLAGATASPGLPLIFKNLLAPEEENKLWKVAVPTGFIGKTVKELADYFRQEHQAVLIGLLKEQKTLGLDQILTDDYSAIDQFIKQKFEEAGKDYAMKKERIVPLLNPPMETVLTAEDGAVVLARKRP